jgi:hypothetical protein
MEKFKLQPGESILKKSSIIYYPSETKDMSAFRAAFKVKQCAGFLTSARLVGCTRLVVWPWGPLIWLIKWMLGRKILFEVPLGGITLLKKVEGNQQFLIQSSDGSECIIAFEAFRDARGKWMQAIADAVAMDDPNAKIHASDDAVEIARS